MNATEHALTKPDIPLVKVEKKKSTGTREMATLAKALDNIHDGMCEFMDVIYRSEEKNSEIAAKLDELIMAIKENPDHLEPEIREAIKDIRGFAFEEKFYTEKCNKGVIRMTDDTKLSHLRAFASEAAKVAGAKFKLSAGDYIPKPTVVEKARETIHMIQRVLRECLGPIAGDQKVREVMKSMGEIWDV